jgi:hypothetical protein
MFIKATRIPPNNRVSGMALMHNPKKCIYENLFEAFIDRAKTKMVAGRIVNRPTNH